MSRFLQLFSFLFCFVVAQQASALLEFNVGYQGILSNSGGGNWTVPGMTMSGAYGLQADFRFEIPVQGSGLGLRYGKLGLEGSSGANTVLMNNDTTSLLFAYRFINTGILLGTVLTYGISSSGTLKNTGSNTNATVSAGSASSYTAGIEIGIKIPILLAAEFGYGSLQMSSFGTQTIAGSATNVNLTGTYARASAGFSF